MVGMNLDLVFMIQKPENIILVSNQAEHISRALSSSTVSIRKDSLIQTARHRTTRTALHSSTSSTGWHQVHTTHRNTTKLEKECILYARQKHLQSFTVSLYTVETAFGLSVLRHSILNSAWQFSTGSQLQRDS